MNKFSLYQFNLLKERGFEFAGKLNKSSAKKDIGDFVFSVETYPNPAVAMTPQYLVHDDDRSIMWIVKIQKKGWKWMDEGMYAHTGDEIDKYMEDAKL